MGRPTTQSMAEAPFSTFEECTQFVQGWETGKKSNNDEKLRAYGLYKQATVGDVNIDRPGMFSFEAKSKWDAWKACEGKSTEDAQAAYLEEIKEQFAKYGP